MKSGNRTLLIAVMLTFLTAAAAQELSIAGASDLAAVSKPLAQAFEKQQGGKVRVRFTLGSSGILARQIENGAPFDVFLSANERYILDLTRTGRIEGFSARTYATGVLGLWSANGRIQALEALTGARHVAMANPLHAPYGVAAREVLEKADLWTKVQPKIVYGENVRQALQFAESGNADAVLTAWPLLAGKPGAIRISTQLHQPIRQVGGVVKVSKQREIGVAFLDFLTKGEGAAILTQAGFQKP